ncbi:cholesterol esterase [Streptomyces olivaceus]|uniref:DUF6230 family protein n=1 Tax=Streptomyces TaxID=1883 RepID=UPI00141379E6|nr:MULTISPECIES: DUF6230 family protein [Streptomyces]MBZ6199839.1 cholesterol esterase [Streptomyces olivaceus]MBZ6304868.1 cholesterol esterase [Streptomyces olivaceus]MBZ6317868.1 cholesterol esterase [Streptomyces olivaceus]QIP73336.1 cholesterol esterase [Streptomyces sp. VN1]
MAPSPDDTPSAGNTSEHARPGRVRLRRAAVLAVPAAAVTATLAVLTAQGALGVQFAISGMPFTVTATELDGNGFAQFGGLDNMAEGSPNAGDTGGQVLVVTSVIENAKLTKLCQSVDLGGTNLLITAGDGSTRVSASNLTTDSTFLSGDASFNNIEIGNDAGTLDKAGPKGRGPIGVFSQQADTVHIKNLRQTNYATTAAVFKLPGLKLRFSGSGC